MISDYVADLIVKLALREDIGAKDLTSALLPRRAVKADIEFGEEGVLCGIEIAERVFRHVDSDLRFLPVAKDGEWIEKGREVAYIEGQAASVLAAERTALNFIGHLSGIASLTKKFVDLTAGTRAQILDTRKTTPNLRGLEKYAVRCGGGTNHRKGLFDQVLIKDNHLKILRAESIPSVVARAKKVSLKKTVIGVEVKNAAELKAALKSQADYILLDNMDLESIRQAVELRKEAGVKTAYEVSGGVSLETVRAIAETGIERISVGTLTHSAPSLNVSLDIVG